MSGFAMPPHFVCSLAQEPASHHLPPVVLRVYGAYGIPDDMRVAPVWWVQFWWAPASPCSTSACAFQPAVYTTVQLLHQSISGLTCVCLCCDRQTLVEQGVTCGTVHVRGGGMHGPAWHEAGRGDLKVRGLEDLLAAAEHLIANKYCHPGRLCLVADSAGR